MRLIRKLYVAGSFLEKNIVNAIERRLAKEGFGITSTWIRHAGTENPVELEEQALIDARGISIADALVVVLPGRYSTASEIGLAIGFKKPVVLLGKKDDRNLFFYHPLVTAYPDIESLIEGLKQNNARTL